jgi:hypothetical protein
LSRNTGGIIAGLFCLVATFWWSDCRAVPEQLNCVLTDTAAQQRSGNRPLVVTIDDAANSLNVREGDQSHTFQDVSISSVAVSGHTDGLTLGIDRSSLGVVFQSFGGAGRPATIEFGRCQRTDATTDRSNGRSR